jgi:hypothetical protein
VYLKTPQDKDRDTDRRRDETRREAPKRSRRDQARTQARADEQASEHTKPAHERHKRARQAGSTKPREQGRERLAHSPEESKKESRQGGGRSTRGRKYHPLKRCDDQQTIAPEQPGGRSALGHARLYTPSRAQDSENEAARRRNYGDKTGNDSDRRMSRHEEAPPGPGAVWTTHRPLATQTSANVAC